MDIHSTFETLAEAWVAASTPTAVNPEPKALKGSATDDQPSMLPKEQSQAEKTHEHPGDNSNDHNDDHHHHHHGDNDDSSSSMTQHQATFRASSSPPPMEMRDSPAAANTNATTSSFTSPSSQTPARGLTGHKTPSPRKPESAQPGIASMPIRCVVEQVNGAVSFDSGGGSAPCEVVAVEQDTFAILPVSTPLRDLVRTALARLGYSSSDAVCAKGAIQLKNWKPLTFDVITDDKSATIDDILRELKEYTLRIRLSSHPRLTSVEEMKEKLLQLLLTSSQSMLMNTGCPVEKSLLMSLSKGENFVNVTEDTVAQFDAWYTNQISKDLKSTLAPTSCATPSNSKTNSKVNKVSSVKSEPDANVQAAAAAGASSDAKLASLSSSSSLSSTSSPSSASHQPQFLTNGAGSGSHPQQSHALQPSSHATILAPSKTRIRTSFDPEHEIPRLQKWFQDNQHPTREQMVRYMSELNNLDSRKGRRPLDLTNIIYWFKNARAAQRRASKALDDSFENEENVDVSNGHATPLAAAGLAEAPATVPPYLPNKNAVYIVPYPYHAAHAASASSSSSSNALLAAPPEPMGDSNDEPCDLSIKKLKDTTSNQQDAARAGQSARGKAEGCVENGEVSSSNGGGGGGGRSNGGHSRKSSPVRNGFLPKTAGSREEGGGSYKSPFGFSGAAAAAAGSEGSDSARRSGTPSAGKERRHNNGESLFLEDRKLLEKHYQRLKDQEGRDQRLVMDLKEEAEASSDESLHSNDTDSSRLRVHEEEEEEEAAAADYAALRARAELGMGMGQLAATSESSAASMAALSLAQMSQPPLQIPMGPLNPLAMYYNIPRYYHPPPSHHHHHHHQSSAAAATAAMVAAFSGSAHLNGHSNGAPPSSGASNPQSPAGGRPIPIQPAPHPPPPPPPHPHHPPLSSASSHGSSEPRKRRTRVFIDPLTEIPKLEKWFLEDTHPSAYMIDKYTETLNAAEYRQKFPKLEPKNIQLWFKNHRAKVKRQRVGLGGEDSTCDSPPPPGGSGSRSGTPVSMVTGRGEDGGSGTGDSSSPDHAGGGGGGGSSKHRDDAADNRHEEEEEEEEMEEGEQ